ncbi:MAG: lysophospholipase [Pseudomonadota bacterium]
MKLNSLQSDDNKAHAAPIVQRDFSVVTADGLTLQGRYWAPQKILGVLAWVHGYAEHRTRYAHFGHWMASRGMALVIVDLRGYGDSPGQRGYVADYAEYFHDVSALLNFCKTTWPGIPMTLGAHSMGALIAARYLEENLAPINISAVVLTGIFMGLYTPLPFWKNAVARIAARVFPRFSLPNHIPINLLTHDTGICHAYATHPLVFHTGAAGWHRATIISQKLALQRARQIQLPCLILHGLDDRLASPSDALALYENISSTKKQWIGYPGLYHEILNELNREQIYTDILNWLMPYLEKHNVS